MKFALRPVKFDERSEDVVNLGEICNFHVHAKLLVAECCGFILTVAWFKQK